MGKYGSFPSNLILDRPYNVTYELLDKEPGQNGSSLRILPATELHADTIAEEEAATNSSSQNEISLGDSSVEFQLVSESGEVVARTNRETIDDSARQTLTMAEIETLKREGTGAGKEIIAKLMASHLGMEQKTAFGLAKYKLLKTKKYLRRFTVLPLDVRMLGDWLAKEKDFGKIMEIREETLGLVASWSNVHFSEAIEEAQGGRWLVVDEIGGLLVATLAERMGILYHDLDRDAGVNEDKRQDRPLATSNTITLIHTNAQPNLSLLSYFNFSPTALTTSPTHPLSTNLLPISWLQLISPERDTTYSTSFDILPKSQISAMKAGKKGTYYRKLRRHTRTTTTVDSTRAGGFDGLVVASHMDPLSIMRHTVHLLRGGATVTFFSPTVESLVTLADAYSTSRRTAFIQSPPSSFVDLGEEEKSKWQGDEDFPLNPTLLLNATVQSARVREWQVLPGRTHPLMTGRGGAEGYLFTAVKVLPAQGKVEARGKFAKKRTTEEAPESYVAKRSKVEAEISKARQGVANEEPGGVTDAIMS